MSQPGATMELIRRIFDGHEKTAEQYSELIQSMARLDERLQSFIAAAEQRSERHSGRIDEATVQAARAVTMIMQLEGKITALVDAAAAQAIERENRISTIERDAKAAQTTLTDWKSKMDLLAKVATFVGIGGIVSFATLLVRELSR